MKLSLIASSVMCVTLSACAQNLQNKAAQQSSLNNQSLNISSISHSSSSLDSEWSVYENQYYSIQYPKKLDTNSMGGPPFGPGGADAPWNIQVVDISQTESVEQIIEMAVNLGYEKRYEKREDIAIDGRHAVLVTITDNKDEMSGWVSKTVLIPLSKKLIVIENGADFALDQQYNFDKFFNSIHLKTE